MNSLGIYVHVPFCQVRCAYCDFYVTTGSSLRFVDPFFSALKSELSLKHHLGWNDYLIETIFFGGGTPSFVSEKHLHTILNEISKQFQLTSDVEISIEINPEDVTPTKAKSWRKLGITRASLGIQSVLNENLQQLHRVHDAKTAITAYQQLRSSGFSNISLDVIYGLPGQTEASWESELLTICTLAPDHVSAYSLTLEKGTLFYREYQKGRLSIPAEQVQENLFFLTRNILETNGFHAYELSNFAKSPLFESRHNRRYWEGKEYWGVGPSAHSFQRDYMKKKFLRFWNSRHIRSYIDTPKKDREELTPKIHYFERMLTGLRLTEGIDLRQVSEEAAYLPPVKVEKFWEEKQAAGLAKLKNHQLRLTPKGLVVMNTILANLNEVLG